MTFENNTFIAITNSTYGHVGETDGDISSVFIDGVIPGNNIVFKNNQFISNYRSLWLGGSDIKFVDNVITRTGVTNNNYENIIIGFWQAKASGNLFLNQSFVNSGEFDSILYRSTDLPSTIKNITVQWHLDIQTNNAPNAQIDIDDVFGTPVYSGQTDAFGYLRVNLTQFTESCNLNQCPSPTKIYHTPHNVIVESQSRLVTMDQNQVEVFDF